MSQSPSPTMMVVAITDLKTYLESRFIKLEERVSSVMYDVLVGSDNRITRVQDTFNLRYLNLIERLRALEAAHEQASVESTQERPPTCIHRKVHRKAST